MANPHPPTDYEIDGPDGETLGYVNVGTALEPDILLTALYNADGVDLLPALLFATDENDARSRYNPSERLRDEYLALLGRRTARCERDYHARIRTELERRAMAEHSARLREHARESLPPEQKRRGE